MSFKTIELSAANGQPEINVFIGQAQFGDYRVMFKSPKTGAKVVEGEGDNADDIADTFPFKTPLVDVDGGVLTWFLNIIAFSDEEQLYFARFDVRQQGKTVEGGVFEYSGQFTSNESIVGVAKVVVT